MPKPRRETLTAMLFISPWLIGLAVFTLYPLAASLYYSFTDFDVLSKPVWIGAGNYMDMAGDAVFWKSLYNTLFYAVFAIPLGLILSLLVAVLLNQAAKGQSIFRTLFFLPSIVPIIAVSMIWYYVFNGDFGLINFLLKPVLGLINNALGTDIKPPSWLTNPYLTKPTLILAGLWQIGGTVIIFLASLQDVPRSLYESAELDGANPAHKLWHITVPIISPVIYFNLIIGIINALQIFVTPFVLMPDGGTDRSALMYTVYLYDNAFRFNQMGYASAMAWVMFLIVVALTWSATKLSRKHIYYAGA
ncbi:MAG: carbohydrate ABC transporter permease [Phycisphaerales bacterium JB063]